MAIAAVAARVPDYLAGGVHPSRAVLRVAASWYTVGPALVLCLAGATSPDWGDWTIYLGALGALAHLGVGLRMRVRPVANELVAIYSVDALLAPVGLLAAFAAATKPWASLLVLPLLGLSTRATLLLPGKPAEAIAPLWVRIPPPPPHLRGLGWGLARYRSRA